jgi:hypothetical protein
MARERFNRAADEAVIDAVASVAAARGVAPAHIAIAWLLGHPGITAPIIEATRLEHLDAPVQALGTVFRGARAARGGLPDPAAPAAVPAAGAAQALSRSGSHLPEQARCRPVSLHQAARGAHEASRS